jgi:hypothetical protein
MIEGAKLEKFRHEEVEMIEGSAKAVNKKACINLLFVNNLNNFS